MSSSRDKRESWGEGWSKNFISSPPGGGEVRYFIEESVLRRIKTYAQIADDMEIGGFGFVRRMGKSLVVYDIMLPHQEVSSGGIDLKPIDAIEYGMEHHYPSDHLRFSWHTHGRGTTFWSPIDETWIHELGEQGIPWLLSLVTNADYSLKRSRIDFFEPVRFHLDDIHMVELMDRSTMEELFEEANEKVKVKSPKVTVVYKGKNLDESESDEEEKSAKDERQRLIDQGLIIPAGTDIDRDDIDESEAARILADVGIDIDQADITIVDERHMATWEDEEDEARLHDAAQVQLDEIKEELDYPLGEAHDLEIEVVKGEVTEAADGRALKKEDEEESTIEEQLGEH